MVEEKSVGGQDRPRRSGANGLAVLATVALLTFAAFVAWFLLRALAFASPALVPVLLGFFLALFFRPYYHWWRRLVHNPTLALVVMCATIFVPVGFAVWYAGAVVVDQISNLISQGPHLAAQVTAWFRGTFPRLHSLLVQMGVPYESLGDFYTQYGATALKAGTGALKLLGVLVSALVTVIFFVFFLTTRERRGSEIVEELAFLKPETRAFVAEQFDAFTGILVSFFQRQAVICLVEGVLYGVGFTLVGLPYGFLVGFALGTINLVPFLGSLVCLPVARPDERQEAGQGTGRIRGVARRAAARRLLHHSEDPGRPHRARLRRGDLFVLPLVDAPRSAPRDAAGDSAVGVLRRSLAGAEVEVHPSRSLTTAQGIPPQCPKAPHWPR